MSGIMRGFKRKGKQMDLPIGAVEIYEKVCAIEAVKGEDSEFPNEQFRHNFEEGARLYGLKDGSILIKSEDGKRLWGEFEYDIGEEEDE